MEENDFVLFWGGTYSQWIPSVFKIDGVEYNTAEQYMMAKKALMFNDYDSLKKIMESKHPQKQKALGKKVVGFDKEKWEESCRDIVYDANYAKFTQNEDMLKELLDTGEREIVEASPYDKIWGIGLDENDPRALDKEQWLGTNWLGEAIMRVRVKLVEEGRVESIYKYRVPETLEECFTAFDETLSPDSITTLLKTSEDNLGGFHHSSGRAIRNDWGLWGSFNGSEETKIYKFFTNIGINHADDMSGIIMTSYHRYLHRKDIDLETQVEKYWKHWLESGSDVSLPTKIDGVSKEWLEKFNEFTSTKY